MKEITRYFYLCNGKMWCSKRKDGRKNEFCYINALDTDYCYHTTDINFRKNKNGNNFDIIEHDECVGGETIHYIDYFEVDNKYGDSINSHFRQKCDMKMEAEMELMKTGAYEEYEEYED